jgi:carboxyl-terminal processing protease
MMNGLKSIWKLMLVGLIVLFACLFAAFKVNDFELAKHLDIYYSVIKEVLINYVDEADPGELIENSIHGMLIELDPYTNYIPENDIENYRVMTTGEYGGLGALFRQNKGKTYIVETYEESPAAKAGLKPGDVILAVDGKEIGSRSADELEQLFLGQPGTLIKLSIQHPGNDQIQVLEIQREKIEMKSVPHYELLEDGTAYVNLSSFTTKAYAEVHAALVEMKKQGGMKSVLLDLRDNPGGLLMEAVKIVNLFVPKGQEVVSTKGKVLAHNKTFTTFSEPWDLDIPVIVLVNERSASASEIVAGCLQDLDRGIVMGTRTFGKGLVQQTIDLSYNSKLKITTSKYYIPSGRCIQALDYSHRNADGTVGEIPDSLRSVFYTKKGRPVKDGLGIEPDFVLDASKLDPLVASLLAGDFIFDYVTRYTLLHDSLPGPLNYQYDSNLFRDFADYVKNQDFQYKSESDQLFELWVEKLKSEGKYESNQAKIQEFSGLFAQNMVARLQPHSAQIELALVSELMLRYHQKSGQIQYIIRHDPLVQEALRMSK